MALSTAQLQALKADILANPDLASQPEGSDGADAIAKLYNLPASPDFIVWKTKLHEHEITAEVSAEGTSWSWVIYKSQTLSEQNCWARMFNGTYTTNPSLPNVRAAFTAIFSGAGAAAQRTHLEAISKRKATRAEKLLASGTGSVGSPATMSFEGSIRYQDIEQARIS